MTDVETKVSAVGAINSIQSADLSPPLREAVATIVQDIPASDSMFRTTKAHEGADISDNLAKAIEFTKQQWKEGGAPSPVEFAQSSGTLETGIVETVGHLAADNKGSIPDDIKDALKRMAVAGGMSANDADKNISRLETGEQEIYNAKGLIHNDKEGLAAGQIDVNAAMGPLKDAVEKGLKLDLATHASGDAAAIAKLPALQQGVSQSAERQ